MHGADSGEFNRILTPACISLVISGMFLSTLYSESLLHVQYR